jgi:hypothetical protein
VRAEIARRAQAPLKRALDRITRGSVIVTEYPATPRPRWGWGDAAPHPEIHATLAAGADEYAALLSTFERHLPALRAIPRDAMDELTPSWANDYFGGLDAVALYSFLAERKPARYVEVGSGNSTRFARRAIEDFGLSTTVTSIDPAPRAEIDALCNEVHRVGLQDAAPAIFDNLVSGDILLIDGSHVVHMNSDVAVVFTEVLPRLPEGVLVGIDDIFLPMDYPPTWEDRWYAEQYLLAVLLLSRDPTWRTVLPAFWVTNEPSLANSVQRFDDPAGTVGVMFWMERVAPA